jgi:hypothetical protein
MHDFRGAAVEQKLPSAGSIADAAGVGPLGLSSSSFFLGSLLAQREDQQCQRASLPVLSSQRVLAQADPVFGEVRPGKVVDEVSPPQGSRFAERVRRRDAQKGRRVLPPVGRAGRFWELRGDK